jgi:hypothetical protein
MAVPTTPSPARQRKRIRAVVHKPGDGRLEFDREAIKDGLFIVGLPLLAIVAAFWFSAKYIKPATPDRFVMTTGPEGGAYQLFALEYQKILARDNIHRAKTVGRFGGKFAAAANAEIGRRSGTHTSRHHNRRTARRPAFARRDVL